MKRVHGVSAEQRPIWFEDAHETILLILPFRHESPLPLKIWRESKSGFHVGCIIGNEWVGKNAQLPNHPRVMGSHSNLERYWDITGSLRFYWLTPYVESNILIKKLLEGKGAVSSSLSEKFKQMTGGSSLYPGIIGFRKLLLQMVILFLYIRKRTSCFWFTSAVKNPTFFLWETVVTLGNHLCWKPLSFVYHTFCKTLVLLSGVRIDLRGFVKNCSELRRWASLLSYLASNMAIVKLEFLHFLRNEEIYLQLSQRSWIDIYKQMF